MLNQLWQFQLQRVSCCKVGCVEVKRWLAINFDNKTAFGLPKSRARSYSFIIQHKLGLIGETWHAQIFDNN